MNESFIYVAAALKIEANPLLERSSNCTRVGLGRYYSIHFHQPEPCTVSPSPCTQSVRQMNTRMFYLFVTIALLIICSTTFAQANALDQSEVLNTARKAVATNETWIDRAEFEKPEWNTKNGTWLVLCSGFPYFPAGTDFLLSVTMGKSFHIFMGNEMPNSAANNALKPIPSKTLLQQNSKVAQTQRNTRS